LCGGVDLLKLIDEYILSDKTLHAAHQARNLANPTLEEQQEGPRE